MSERIHKLLASTGVGSRRQVERLIVAGRIIVDGRPAELGQKLAGGERVFVDGKRIDLPSTSVRTAHKHLIYYKPAGELTSREDPEGRRKVFDALPSLKHGRWINIGRLDINTSGLLLLTTDGELAHRLMHPSYEIPREYAIRLRGTPSAAQLEQLTSGIELDDGLARFDKIECKGGSGKNVWCHATLHEGRNREVRRLFEAIGLIVSRLIRVRFGPITLGELHRGVSRRLTPAEIRSLYRSVRLSPPAKDRDR